MKLKPTLSLLGLPLTAPALGIGLGDLSVHSYLEQPLHVSVRIMSPPPTLNVECLSLRPGDSGLPMPARTDFRIERTGEDALLHITTPQAISDPVAEFLLVSDCEGRLQREYALLLDPPPQTEPAGQTMPGSHTLDVPANVPLADTPAATRPAASAARITPAVSSARAPAARPRRAEPAKPAVRAEAPRLVISGKPARAESDGAPAKLGERAAPIQPDASSDGLTAVELSDENASLQRRLAHLEAQLAALHKRNAEIEAQLAAAARARAEPAAPGSSPRWPTYLLGLGLLVGSGVSLAWLSRRSRSPGWPTLRMPWNPPKAAKPVRPYAGIDPALLHFDTMLRDDSLKTGSAASGPKR